MRRIDPEAPDFESGEVRALDFSLMGLASSSGMGRSSPLRTANPSKSVGGGVGSRRLEGLGMGIRGTPNPSYGRGAVRPRAYRVKKMPDVSRFRKTRGLR
jgi:hypothetical protein